MFLDVDCIPAETCLAAITKRASTWSTGTDALLCGPVTYLAPPGVKGDPVALERMINPHPARPAPPDGDVVSSADYELFWSLSFALTAATWRRIGGVCDRYYGYGAEDTDFAQTARAAGVPMRWVGGAHAFHQFHPCRIPRLNICTT